MEVSRRKVLRLGATGVLAALLACSDDRGLNGLFDRGSTGGSDHSSGRLTARPQRDQQGATATGLQPREGGDAVIYVPPGYDPSHPGPLAVTLHGAGGRADRGIGLLREFADEAGLILVIAQVARTHVGRDPGRPRPRRPCQSIAYCKPCSRGSR